MGAGSQTQVLQQELLVELLAPEPLFSPCALVAQADFELVLLVSQTPKELE